MGTTVHVFGANQAKVYILMKKPPFLTPMYITFSNNLCWIGNFERGEKVLLLIGCTKIPKYIHDVRIEKKNYLMQ